MDTFAKTCDFQLSPLSKEKSKRWSCLSTKWTYVNIQFQRFIKSSLRCCVSVDHHIRVDGLLPSLRIHARHGGLCARQVAGKWHCKCVLNILSFTIVHFACREKVVSSSPTKQLSTSLRLRMPITSRRRSTVSRSINAICLVADSFVCRGV